MTDRCRHPLWRRSRLTRWLVNAGFTLHLISGCTFDRNGCVEEVRWSWC